MDYIQKKHKTQSLFRQGGFLTPRSTGSAFDGANIWVANSDDGTLSKL